MFQLSGKRAVTERLHSIQNERREVDRGAVFVAGVVAQKQSVIVDHHARVAGVAAGGEYGERGERARIVEVGKDIKDKHIVVFALRDLKVGEELQYDYQFALGGDKIECHCGAPNCWGRMN